MAQSRVPRWRIAAERGCRNEAMHIREPYGPHGGRSRSAARKHHTCNSRQLEPGVVPAAKSRLGGRRGARRRAERATPPAVAGQRGNACPAEPSPTGNVQVSCLAEDDASPQNTQSETTVVAVGKKVVVGFNDSLVCCVPAIN